MRSETLASTEAASKQRQTNLELFRVITMILIIAHHYVVNSGLLDAGGKIYSNPLCLRSLFLLFFGCFGKIGINCFVLITGYFMCTSSITLKKFFRLFFEVLFYNVVINAVFCLTGYSSLTLKELFVNILPISSLELNFTGCFLLFYLCIPFLNSLLRAMNQRQHMQLMGLALFAYVIMGTIPFFAVRMNYLSWFVVLYLVASYIRLYPLDIFRRTRFWGVAAAICVALCFVSVFCCAWLGHRLGKNIAYLFVVDSNTFLAFLTGVCSFLFFKNLRIPHIPCINWIAASTFGVLQIHANNDAMRRFLWNTTFGNVRMYSSPLMPLHAIGCVLLVFTVCTLLDKVRIHLIARPLCRLMTPCNDKIASLLKKTENFIYNKVKAE
jgi:hypothetical protein